MHESQKSRRKHCSQLPDDLVVRILSHCLDRAKEFKSLNDFPNERRISRPQSSFDVEIEAGECSDDGEYEDPTTEYNNRTVPIDTTTLQEMSGSANRSRARYRYPAVTSSVPLSRVPCPPWSPNGPHHFLGRGRHSEPPSLSAHSLLSSHAPPRCDLPRRRNSRREHYNGTAPLIPDNSQTSFYDSRSLQPAIHHQMRNVITPAVPPSSDYPPEPLYTLTQQQYSTSPLNRPTDSSPCNTIQDYNHQLACTRSPDFASQGRHAKPNLQRWDDPQLSQLSQTVVHSLPVTPPAPMEPVVASVKPKETKMPPPWANVKTAPWKTD